MSLPPIENFTFQNVLTPATAASGFGSVFSVGRRSVVCRLVSDTDDDAGADSAFQLFAVTEFDETSRAPIKSYPLMELDPVAAVSFPLLLGGNMTQAEIVIKGYYVWKKIVITTPLVGVEVATGYESLP